MRPNSGAATAIFVSWSLLARLVTQYTTVGPVASPTHRNPNPGSRTPRGDACPPAAGRYLSRLYLSVKYRPRRKTVRLRHTGPMPRYSETWETLSDSDVVPLSTCPNPNRSANHAYRRSRRASRGSNERIGLRWISSSEDAVTRTLRCFLARSSKIRPWGS